MGLWVTKHRKAPDAFWVYVIELDADALADKDQADLRNGAVYVGYTATSPEARLDRHQAGARTAAAVFKRMKDPYGSRLRMDLSPYAGPYGTRRDARRNEKRTHNRLLSDGYKVFGDKGTRFMNSKKQALRRVLTD